MKRNIFIELSILVVVLSYGCTKKQTVSENSPTGGEVAAQNQGFSKRQPFKYTIKTDFERSNQKDVKIIVSINKLDGQFPVLYDLDCDSDGEYEFTGLSDEHECIYKPNTGKHQISVRGEIPGLFLCARQPYDEFYEFECPPYTNNFRCELSSGFDGSSLLLESIDSWGDISWKSMFAFAADCEALKNIPETAPDLSHVSDMSHMFRFAKLFNQPLEKWDVSKVTDMSKMFFSATSFNQPLEKWNVSNVTNMREMFKEAKSFNQPLEKWDVSNVCYMNNMFNGASKFSHYPKSWVVPENSNDMFVGTKVEDMAKKKPLKVEDKERCKQK